MEKEQKDQFSCDTFLESLEWAKYYKILELFRNSEDGHLLTLFKVAEIPFLNVKLKLDGMNQERWFSNIAPERLSEGIWAY